MIRKQIIQDVSDPADRKSLLGRLVDEKSFEYFVKNGAARWRTFAAEVIKSPPVPLD